MENDLISVIVPVYNVEKYLERCVDSIEENTYKNLEVIIVEDGSTDGSKAVAKRLAEKYNNIKLVEHDENKGLFQARITGVEASSGKYICSIDSDDRVSKDWIRKLYSTITKNNADICVGQFLYEFENGEMSYCNLDPMRQQIMLEGEQVLERFLTQKGTHYSWSLVANKMFTRELWMSAIDDLKAFSKSTPKLVMCEDIAFSFALWTRARKVCNITNGAYYFYFQRSTASTKIADNREKNTDYIEKVVKVFDFGKQQVKKAVGEKYSDCVEAWKSRFAKIQYRDMSKFDKNYYADLICNTYKVDKAVLEKDIEDGLYIAKTTVDINVFNYEKNLIETIANPNTKVVSFDIFDTLVVRPFAEPSHLFKLLEHKYNEVFGISSVVDFAQIRIEGEQRCRLDKNLKRTNNEDVTLDEIYEFISKEYRLDLKKLNEIKNYEVELEIKLCTRRNYIYGLYELAKYLGKTVIATSDMYLSQEVIETILKNNGYEMDKVFVSNVVGLSKWNGTLYAFVKKELGVKGSEIIHIGDNWIADVSNADKNGIKSFLVEKPMALYRGEDLSIYAGDILNSILHSGINHDLRWVSCGYLGYSAMEGLIANKLFDSPFVYYNKESNFNCSPDVIGYTALGPYLFGVTNWIRQKAEQNKVRTIHFVARDGYVPMKAFEIFRKYNKKLPTTDYIYVSRKSMMFADIYKKEDVFSLTHKMNAKTTHSKIIKYFRPYLQNKFIKLDDSEILEHLGLNKNSGEKYFTTIFEFESFLSELFDLIDQKKLNDNKTELKNYFSQIIKKDDILFDIGYSGRQECALTKLLGFPVNSLYVHSNNEYLEKRQSIAHFKNECFYDYKQFMTGVVREHVFMKLAPSTIGYKNVNGTLEPVFEEYKIDTVTEVITKEMQNAALDFVDDYLKTFDGLFDYLYFRNQDLAWNFEYFITWARDFDKLIMNSLKFEDDLGEGKTTTISGYDFWKTELDRLVNNTNIYQMWNQPAWVPEKRKATFKRRCADFVFPYGTKRREFAKKVYYKFFAPFRKKKNK